MKFFVLKNGLSGLKLIKYKDSDETGNALFALFAQFN